MRKVLRAKNFKLIQKQPDAVCYWFLGIFLVLSVYCSLFVVVNAQEEKIFSISPAVIEEELENGETKDYQIDIYNLTEIPQAVKVYVNDFTAENYSGAMKIIRSESANYSISKWVDLSRSNLLLEPGQKETLDFRLSVPKNAEPGGYYGVIFFEPLDSAAFDDDSSLGVVGRMGALLEITVGGEIVEAGQVMGATTNKDCTGVGCSFTAPGFLEYGPVSFTFDFENTGNVHVGVSGKIEIYNIFRQKIAEIPIEEKTVLPGTIRTFEAKWMRELLTGRYRAKLILNYGSEKTTEVAYLVFWGIPWKLGSGAVVFAGVVSGVVLFARKRKNKRKKTEDLAR